MSNDTFQSAISAAEQSLRTNHAYFAPSDEPLNWDTSGLVRLDHAIYAVHLYAARLTFRSFAHQAHDVVLATVKDLGAIIGNQLVLRVIKQFGQLVGYVERVLLLLVETWFQEKTEMQVEKAIRRQSLIAQREMLALKMKPSKKRRSTEWVRSRHPSPPQRKANKRWLKTHPK